MKKEQLETMHILAEKGKEAGELWDRILEASFIVHGHVCGGMPLGFRAGLAAHSWDSGDGSGALLPNRQVLLDGCLGGEFAVVVNVLNVATYVLFGRLV